MNNQATYRVAEKTKSAQLFDERPQLGTGGIKLNQLRESAPGHADVFNALHHLASHVNGIVITKEKLAGNSMVTYAEANPPKEWGRATMLARDTMAKKLDPRLIIASKRV